MIMRTLVDLDDAQVLELDNVAKRAKRSRAALIREAIADYLSRTRRDAASDAYGIWGKRKVDGLAYQKSLREEW